MKNHITLTEVRPGRRARIRMLHTLPEVNIRLRELGFREDAVIRCVMRGYGNVICEISNTRVGLDSDVADGIYVSSFE